MYTFTSCNRILQYYAKDNLSDDCFLPLFGLVEINLRDNEITGTYIREQDDFGALLHRYLFVQRNHQHDVTLFVTLPPLLHDSSFYILPSHLPLHLQGPVPRSLITLKQLEGLYLHDSKYTGMIPLGMANLNSMSGIFLHGNYFESELSFCSTLNFIIFLFPCGLPNIQTYAIFFLPITFLVEDFLITIS